MEEFEFTPKEELVVQNEADFTFTPKEEPDFSKLKADEVVSPDGTNTNASQKMNAVLNSWIGKGTKIYDAAYAIDQTRKSATRGIFEIEKNLGTLAKVAGDNLSLLERNTEKMLNSGGTIGTLLKLMGGNLNAINDKGYTEGEMCRLRTVGDSINEIGDLVQKHADSVLNNKDLQLDEEITKGDFMENPSWTRAFMAMGNAMPSLLGMGVLAKISGPLSAYFVMAGVDSADVYEKAKEKDTSQTEANLRFGSSVVATAAIDKVLGPLEHMMKASPNRLSKKLAKYIFDGALESVAEGLQTGAQNAFQIYNSEDIQNLGAGVIESMIGGFGSGAVASSLFSEASDNLKKQGATDEDINTLLDVFGMSAQQNADKLSQVAFQEVSKGLKEFDKFIEEKMGTPEAQKALKTKAELQDVYDAMYNTMIQAGRPEAEAKSISQIWQGIALFGSQETGMTPMEYLRRNSPKAKAEKYAEFKKNWEAVRNKVDNAPVNPFKLLMDKKAYDEAVKAEKARKGKSLLAFIKKQGGVIDEGGDLKSRDAIRQYPGLVNNKNGLTLDDMALLAWEAGYLNGETDYSGEKGRPSINTLLEAIDDELSGVKHYANDTKEKSVVDLVDDIAQALDELGIDYSNMSAKEAEDAYWKAADDYVRKAQNMTDDEEAAAMADYYANGDGKLAQKNEIDEWADIPFQKSLDIARENERLDAVYPAYEGETININGKERTVYNSNGDRIAKSKEALENFYKWFGDSKVVDEQGRPLVVYHGTRAMKWGKPLPEFSIFSRAGSRAYQNRVGFFFGETESFARAFGDRIMPVYLNLQNPKIFKKGTPTNEELSLEQKEVDTAKSDDTKYIAQKILNNSKKYTDAYDKFIMDMYHKSGLIPYQNSMYGDFNDAIQLGRDEAYDIADTYREELQKDGYDGVIIVDTKVDANSNNGKPNTQYVAFEPNQIKSTSNRGTYSESENIYYQFAGEKAQTAALDELDNAKQLEADGVDNEEIRQQTGWFKGVDGKWRFEISDADASLDIAGYFKDKTRERIARWEELLKTHPYEDVKETLSQLKKRLKNLDNMDIYDVLSEDNLNTAKLGDILKHDKLYAAYPQLRDYEIFFYKDNDKNKGGYVDSSTPNRIYINIQSDSFKSDDLKNVLMHEIQHMIQTEEGFARGGSEDDYADVVLKENDKIRKNRANLVNDIVEKKFGKKFDNNDGNVVYLEAFENYDGGTWRYEQHNLKRSEVLNELRKNKDNIVKKQQDFVKNNTSGLSDIGAFEYYRRLAGEIEARNTALRTGFTDETRRRFAPEKTQDVANADAIVVFGDGTEMAYEPKSVANNNIMFQGGEIANNNPANVTNRDNPTRITQRDVESFLPEEQEAFDSFLSKRPDKERILKNLKEHKYDSKGKITGYYKNVIEGIFIQEAIDDYFEGKPINFESALDARTSSGKKSSLMKVFESSEFNSAKTDDEKIEVIYRRYLFGSILAHPTKVVNSVNSSLINCNPSPACAQFCYATKGNYTYIANMPKKEVLDVIARKNPKKLAQWIAQAYKTTVEYSADKALRLFDMGDGNEHWVEVAKELNKQGIRVAIFTKKPDFMRAIKGLKDKSGQEANLTMLSIDSTNEQLAKDNKDLDIAYVYQGEENLKFVKELQEEGRLSVVLPVKLGRDFMSEAEVKKLTDAGIEKKHICPIDAGWGKLHKANDKTPINMKDGNELKPVKIGEWNCALCDRYGGMGCYFKKTTRQLKEMLENYRANGLTNEGDDVNILIEGLGEILQANKLTEGLSDEIIKQLGITDEQIAKRASVLQGKMGAANARVFAGFSIILERARHRQSELERSAKELATEEGLLGSEARPSIRDNGKTQSVLRGRSESGEGKQTDVRGVSRDISADSGSGVLNENDVNYQSAYVSMKNELEGDYLDADRFEGTGEGNAVHGWGNYALKDRKTNKIRYYDWMSQDKIYYDGEEVDGKEDSAIKRAVDEYIVNGKDAEKTKKSIRGIIKSSEYDIKVTEKQISDLGEAYHISKEEIRLLRELKDLEDSFYELSLIDRKGTIEKAQEIRAKLSPKAIYESDRFNMAFNNLDTAERVKNLYKEALDVDFSKIEVKRTGAQYEIDVPEDEFLLDEDLTFRNQSEYVQKRVKKLVEEENLNKIFEIYQSEERPNYNTLENEDGRSIYQAIAHALGSQKAASKMLEKYGIKGIKYEGSVDGIGYVIFKGADAPIMRRLLQSTKGLPKGAFTPDNVIHLFEGADASTFMHETAHWFRAELKRFGTARSREMLRKVDAWENAEFDKRYKVELKDGAYVIKDQRGNLVYDLQFNTEEEARDYGKNEIFARGFEQYLRTGKAPNSYLKNAFKSFWNWLRTLYRSAKQLNADINQDIEDVYGTILGGEELDFYLNETPERALQQKFADNDERAKLIDENIARAQAMATEPKMFENFVAERTESKKGKAEFLTNLIVPISTRAKRVSQGLKNRLRAYDYALPQKLNEYNSRIKPFMDKWAKFNQDDMVAFDLALKNDYVNKQLAILEKYDAVDDFEAVHDLLNLIYDEAKSVGVDIGYRENYFPREVADVDGLMSYLYGPSAVSELRRAEREAHYEDMLPEEQAEFVNKFLRGYERKDLTKSLPGNVKERRIDVVTSDMNVFYKNSMQALMTYIERMTNSIESRRFWGMDAAHIDESIGAFVDDMIARGEIKPEQDKEVENILRARFKARGVSNKFLLYQKNMAYIYTMGGINSAITQIDDISVALYKAGLWNTVQSIFAPKHQGLSREELGLTRIGEEFMEASASSKAVSAVFKATGLDKIDAFGKNVLINATFKKFQKMANSDEAKLREYLEPIMEQETDATIEAIKNDEITDNVKLLMFNELADMQPISLSEMPEYYLRSGNGRVLYMLKTFALKRIDIFRNEAFDEMRKGNVKGGVQNLFKLSLLMMLCGMGKDALIDLLFGRKIVLSDAIVNNLLGLFGFSKYQLYRARSDGFTGLLTSVAVPPILPMYSDLFKDMYKSLFTKNGEDIENWEVWKGIPIIGRFYYWWMGGGYAKEQKKKKKLK